MDLDLLNMAPSGFEFFSSVKHEEKQLKHPSSKSPDSVG